MFKRVEWQNWKGLPACECWVLSAEVCLYGRCFCCSCYCCCCCCSSSACGKQMCVSVCLLACHLLAVAVKIVRVCACGKQSMQKMLLCLFFPTTISSTALATQHSPARAYTLSVAIFWVPAMKKRISVGHCQESDFSYVNNMSTFACNVHNLLQRRMHNHIRMHIWKH